MDDEILCPSCSHSLAFHKYDYGSCEAPLGGLTSKNMCGCPFTTHTYIRNLQAKDNTKEFERLLIRHNKCVDEMFNVLETLKAVAKKIEFLESKLKIIRELLDKTKPLEKARFGISYRNEVIKIVDEIILELEKDMENG